MSASQVFSGARAILKFGNLPVGYCLGVNGNSAINYQPIQAIGHLEALEHVPSAYTVEMSANLSRLANFTRLNKGQNFPGLRTGDGLEGSLISPQIMPAFGDDGSAILKSGEMTATIFDRVLKQSLTTVSGVKCSQKSWDISAAGAVSENCSFVARIANELNENDQAMGDAA